MKINVLKIYKERLKVRVFLIMISLTCLISFKLVAQPSDYSRYLFMTLEELLDVKIESATKTSEKNQLTPSIVTVITASEIRNYGYSSVAEALSHVTSFVDNANLSIHNFGVRGINSGVRSGSRTIKFMIDGQSIAFRSTSQNFIDKELVPMEMIERIEVVRGPVSALYGANAFLGVVNIVTKPASSYTQNGGNITAQLNSNSHAGNGYGFAATYGDQVNDWNYSLGMSYSNDDRAGVKLPRRSPDYDNFDRFQSQTDTSKPLSFYAKSKYQLNENNQFKLSGFYQKINLDEPFSDLKPLQENTTKINLDNQFIRADYELKINDKLKSNVFFSHSQGGTLSDDKIEVAADSFYLTRRFGFSAVDFGAELYVSLRDKDTLLLGLDSKREQQKIESFTRVNRFTGDSIELNPSRDETISDVGFYLQYLMQLNNHWRTVFGLRSDDDSVIGRQNSARLGLVGELENHIILKILAGSAYQAPSAELLYRTAVQSGDIIGNPNLSAQQVDTLEISAAIPINKTMHFTATYFNTRVDDLVIFESDSNNLIANNSSASKTNGIELEFKYLLQGLSGYANYTWQDTTRDISPSSLFVLEQRKSGEIFPEQSANFGVSYHWDKINSQVSLNNLWVGKRQASTQNVLIAHQFYELESYMDTSLTITTSAFSFLQNKTATTRFQVKDLFDNQHVNPGFGGIEFPTLGRQFVLSFEQRF